MVRSLRGIVLFALVALLAACSDYPSSGVVDTRDVRENGNIEEISGKVFGLKEGAFSAAGLIRADFRAIHKYSDQVWKHVVADEPMPTVKLSYDISDKPVKEALELMLVEAKAKQKKVRDEIDAKVADLEAKKQKLVAEKAEAQASGADYNNAVASAKGEFEKAKVALDASINRYNAAIEAPVTQLNAVASEHGLEQIASHRNPLTSYRFSEFKDGKKPATCPAARNKFAVNLMGSHNKCLYFDLPQGYDAHPKQVSEVLKASIIELEAASDDMGKKGSWNRKSTGAYAAYSEAEDGYKIAMSKARDSFGDDRRRQAAINNADVWIKQYEKQIEEASSQAEYDKQIGWTNFYTSSDVEAKLRLHRDAAHKEISDKYLVTLGDVTRANDKGDGKFDAEDGYEYIVTVTDILASNAGGYKKVLRHTGVINVTSQEVKDADSLNVETLVNDMDVRPDNKSVEKMREDLVRLMINKA